MVPIWRPSVHHRGIGHGAGHGPGPRIPLLRPRTAKVGLVDDVGMYGGRIGGNIPMVLVGILVGFLAVGEQWIHWRSQEIWLAEFAGKP
jgi:hypothetical protein